MTVLERYVSLGDVVQKFQDNNQMIGTVTNISMFLTIETKKGVLSNVNVENVKHIHPFQRDQFVITKKGRWIGRVFNSICDVTLLFEDGAVCVIPEADSSVLKVIGKEVEEDNPEAQNLNFNPGDIVRATKKVLKEADWINGKNNNKRGMATVIDVQPTVIFVDWLNNGDWELKDDFPPGEATPKELLVIDPFEKYNWGIGDFCFLRKGMENSKELDTILKADFEKPPIASLKAKNNNKGALMKNFLNTSVGKVVSLSTMVDVQWQDGTFTQKLSSIDIIPVHETTEKDFFPDEYVISQENPNDFGVIQSVNIKDMTCVVKWSPDSTISKDRLDQNGNEVDVPIFAIREHPFQDFRLASCVLRLPTEKNKNAKNWCGFITKTNGFKVTVQWNNKEVTEEDPHTLMILPMGDDDDDDLSLGDGFEGGDENELGESKEEEDVQNQSDFLFNFGESKVLKPTKLEAYNKALEETDKMVIVLLGETWNMQCAQMMNTFDNLSNQYQDVVFVYVNIDEYKPEDSTSTSYPAFRIYHKKKFLSSFESSEESVLKGEIERWKQTVNGNGSNEPQNNNTNTNTTQNNNNDNNTQVNESELQVSPVITYTSLNDVQGFAVLAGSPTKHCFLVQQSEVVSPKNVLKEYNLLQNSLPKGVFVRVYESRLDIFRVLIFPSEKSPLCHSPFVFDVQIPSQFPTVPPNFFFNSLVHEKMHPNLFVNGKVCSSLIGTWEGNEGSEFWDPKTSNLQKLLTSFQTSFLSDSEPYYSEPDFDLLKGTDRKSVV